MYICYLSYSISQTLLCPTIPTTLPVSVCMKLQEMRESWDSLVWSSVPSVSCSNQMVADPASWEPLQVVSTLSTLFLSEAIFLFLPLHRF